MAALPDKAGVYGDGLAADPHGTKAPTVSRQHSSPNDMTSAFGIEAERVRIPDRRGIVSTAAATRRSGGRSC